MCATHICVFGCNVLAVWGRHPCSNLRKMAVSLFAFSCAIVLVAGVVAELFTSNFKTYYGLASTLPPYKSSSFKNVFGCARWCSKESCCYAYQFTNTTEECHLLTRENMQNIVQSPSWNIAADQAIGKSYISAIPYTLVSWNFTTMLNRKFFETPNEQI